MVKDQSLSLIWALKAVTTPVGWLWLLHLTILSVPQSLYYRIFCWPFCVVTMFVLLVKRFWSYDRVRSLPFPLFFPLKFKYVFFLIFIFPPIQLLQLKLMNLCLIEFQRKVFEFQSLIYI